MFASLTTFCRRVYALSFEWCSGPHDKARSRQKLLDLIINSQKDYWYNNVCFGLSSTFNTLISKWDFFFFWPLSFPVGKESRGSKAWSFWWSYYQLKACIVCFWVINHPFTHRPQTFWYISLLLCFISFLKSRLISLLQQIPLFPSPWIRAD